MNIKHLLAPKLALKLLESRVFAEDLAQISWDATFGSAW
jgi:hypothetical protein